MIVAHRFKLIHAYAAACYIKIVMQFRLICVLIETFYKKTQCSKIILLCLVFGAEEV